MRCFLHNNLYFSLNHYTNTQKKDDVYVLEVEDDSSATLTELLSTNLVDASIIEEVYGSAYSTHEFSKMK